LFHEHGDKVFEVLLLQFGIAILANDPNYWLIEVENPWELEFALALVALDL